MTDGRESRAAVRRADGEPLTDGRVSGRLVVVEGTDGAGRTTQVRSLTEWLEGEGYAVVDTGLRRSDLAGEGIERAKHAVTLDATTLSLLYATDFWDRFERKIFPALRAGMIVLSDRYVFSLLARGAVRGVPTDWLEHLYRNAPKPDLVVYLDVDVATLVPRVLGGRGFNHWESGADFLPGHDVFGSFVRYQSMLLDEYRRLARRHAFTSVDSRRPALSVFQDVQRAVARVLAERPSQTAGTRTGVRLAPAHTMENGGAL